MWNYKEHPAIQNANTTLKMNDDHYVTYMYMYEIAKWNTFNPLDLQLASYLHRLHGHKYYAVQDINGCIWLLAVSITALESLVIMCMNDAVMCVHCTCMASLDEVASIPELCCTGLLYRFKGGTLSTERKMKVSAVHQHSPGPSHRSFQGVLYSSRTHICN